MRIVIAHKKYLPSFGRLKSRKLRPGSERVLAEVLPRVQISEFPKFEFEPREIWLEVGFGDGGHLLHQAMNNRDVGIIGCEPFVNGTAHLLKGIEKNQLENVRVYHGDFRNLVTSSHPSYQEGNINFHPSYQEGMGEVQAAASEVRDGLPHPGPLLEEEEIIKEWENKFGRVFILFPDPWPKSRHHKKRIINPQTFDILFKIMKPGARLRIGTDHVDYREWILAQILERDDFVWHAHSRDDWEAQPADHILTKYQKKALQAGRKSVFFELSKK